MRSSWGGTLSAGLIGVPIKLYKASGDESRGYLNNLHMLCGGRLKQPKYCPTCEKFVEPNEIMKGHNLGTEDEPEYVVLTDDDLASIALESTKAISIEKFIKLDDDPTDSRWVKDCYYMAPAKEGRKAFALLTQAMTDAEVGAIAKVTMRGDREQLVLLYPFEGIMLVERLYWPDDVRTHAELDFEAEVNPQELELAIKLVTAMTGEVDMATYKDKYFEALTALVESVQTGVKPEQIAEKQSTTNGALFDALQASLKAVEA